VPIPPVVVELPPDAASREAVVLIEACNKSLPERGCRLASGDQGGEPRSGFALVRRRGERTLVIELGVRGREEVRWVLRELSFRADDPEEERWRTAGLVIGTLVGQAENESRRESAPPTRSGAEARSPPPFVREWTREAQPAVRQWRAAIGVDGWAGPALDRGTWRFGAGLGADYRLGSSPAFAHLGLRYAAGPADSGLSVNWASGAAGAGVHWDVSRPLKLESTAALVVERVSATATSGGESDSGSRVAAGARLGAGILFVSSGFMGIYAGAEGTLLASPTRLLVGGQSAGQVQNPTYALGAGLRLRLF
jgi:hypothetical protein